MKTQFDKEYIIANRGCYEVEYVEALKCINNKNITLEDLSNELPYDDYLWWIINGCELTIKELQWFALFCAKSITHLSSDKRVTTCIEVTEKYLNGKATEAELKAAMAATRVTTSTAYLATSDAARFAYLAASDAAYFAARFAYLASKVDDDLEYFKTKVNDYIIKNLVK